MRAHLATAISPPPPSSMIRETSLPTLPIRHPSCATPSPAPLLRTLLAFPNFEFVKCVSLTRASSGASVCLPWRRGEVSVLLARWKGGGGVGALSEEKCEEVRSYRSLSTSLFLSLSVRLCVQATLFSRVLRRKREKEWKRNRKRERERENESEYTDREKWRARSTLYFPPPLPHLTISFSYLLLVLLQSSFLPSFSFPLLFSFILLLFLNFDFHTILIIVLVLLL